MPDSLSAVVVDDDYARLLRDGASHGEDVTEITPEEERERWLEQAAEPWFEAIRERAQADGLKVSTYEGFDPGLPLQSPAAVLLRPDGSRYQSYGHKHELELRRDWSEVLARARIARGLPAETPRPRELPFLLEFLLALWRLFAAIVLRRVPS